MIRSFVNFASASVASRAMAKESGRAVDLWFDGQYWVTGDRKAYEAAQTDAQEEAARRVDETEQDAPGLRTGLAPPEWEDGSPDETLYPGGGSYIHSWDS